MIGQTISHYKIFEKLGSPYYFGIIEFGLGNTERAIDYLYKAYDERDGILMFSGVDPIAEIAWSHPRFRVDEENRSATVTNPQRLV